MKNRRMTALVLLFSITLSMLLFGGCTKKETPTTPVEPVVRKTMNIGYEREVGTMDPVFRGNIFEHTIVDNVFDTLVFSYDDPANIEPRLASEFSISDDGLSYTVVLREGVKFHNGEVLTADDVVFSFGIMKESAFHANSIAALKTCVALDPKTVKFGLDEPSGLGIFQLTYIPIVPAKTYTEKGADHFGQNPIGTGPYKFVSKGVDGRIVLQSNPDYFLGEPVMKEIVAYLYTDSFTRGVALENGEIDLAAINETIQQTLQARNDLTTSTFPAFILAWIILNTEKAPYDNVKVRQAIAYALDRESIRDAEDAQSGVVNSIICNTNVFGYNPDVKSYATNLDKAKQLIAESGIVTPFNAGVLTILESYKPWAEIIQDNLASIGLTIRIEMSEGGAYFSDAFAGNLSALMLNGSFGVDFGVFAQIFHSRNIGSGMNLARYNNPTLDTMIDTANRTMDIQERLRLFKQILEIVQEDVPYIALFQRQMMFGHNIDLVVQSRSEGKLLFAEMHWK